MHTIMFGVVTCIYGLYLQLLDDVLGVIDPGLKTQTSISEVNYVF